MSGYKKWYILPGGKEIKVKSDNINVRENRVILKSQRKKFIFNDEGFVIRRPRPVSSLKGVTRPKISEAKKGYMFCINTAGKKTWVHKDDPRFTDGTLIQYSPAKGPHADEWMSGKIIFLVLLKEIVMAPNILLLPLVV